jgi:hypothetical protein
MKALSKKNPFLYATAKKMSMLEKKAREQQEKFLATKANKKLQLK